MLTKTQLIQINSTIITGILIFLTINSAVDHDKVKENINEIWKDPKLLAYIVILPFAFSAIMELWTVYSHTLSNKKIPEEASWLAVMGSMVGFGYLIFAVAVLVVFSYY